MPGSGRTSDVDLDVDVTVVGGGPAGAALALLLARSGRSVAVLERRPTYRWRACGVFSGPATRPLLQRLGLTPGDLARLARPVPAMVLEGPGGTTVRLTYGADDGGPSALAFDRAALDECLLERAAAAGALVRRGFDVGHVATDRGGARVAAARPAGDRSVRARVLVGADGIRSTVAGAVGVTRLPRLSRVGLTFHVPEEDASVRPAPDDRRAAAAADGQRAASAADDRRAAASVPPAVDLPRDALMVVGGEGYCGLAPVPGGRVNVGIVLRGAALRRLRRDGAETTTTRVIDSVRPPRDDGVRLSPGHAVLDSIAGASPLAHRVVRRAGSGWLLVGDAEGFLDPFTGEGLHRALASSFLAAEVIDAALARGDVRLDGYDRAMRGRFAAKDVVSVIVQLFVARPALLEYASRRLANRRALVRPLESALADLGPASAVLDPRYLARVLAP